MRPLIVPLLLVGCAAPPVSLRRADTAPAADTAAPDSTVPPGASPEGPVVTVETIDAQSLEDGWIFDTMSIHDIEIELSDDAVMALNTDPWSYTSGNITIDGDRLDDVGVRLRGKIGSFRYLSGKPKFKIDFNQYVEDQRFYGLESLSLNNEVVDCSYLKEPLAYEVIRDFGVPTSRTGWARVTVNGASYGLYVVVEVPDEVFTRRWYAEPDGNLYDGKYVWYGGSSYTLLDFSSGVDKLFELEEGVDVGWSDISEVSQALSSSAGTATFYDDMGLVIDWPAFHKEQAAEQWVGQNDGYGVNKNNYRVYFDPRTGLAHLVPWDMDYSFLQDWEWGRSWASPYGNIAYWCMADATCKEAQVAALSDLVDHTRSMSLVDDFDAMAALIEADVEADPRRECSMDSVAYYQAVVRSWLVTRNDSLRARWGIE